MAECECQLITSLHQVRHAEVPSGGRGQVGGQPPRLRRGRRPRPLPRRARPQAAVMPEMPDRLIHTV